MRITLRPTAENASKDLDLGEVSFPQWWKSELWPNGVGRPVRLPVYNGPAELDRKCKGKKRQAFGPSQSHVCPQIPQQIQEDGKWARRHGFKTALQHGFDKSAWLTVAIDELYFDCWKRNVDVRLENWHTLGLHATIAINDKDMQKLNDLIGRYMKATSGKEAYLATIRSFLLDIYSTRIIPELKEDHGTPSSYKLLLLENARRASLLAVIEKAKCIAEKLDGLNLDTDLAEWVARISQSPQIDLYHDMLGLAAIRRPRSQLIRADIGPGFSSESDDPDSSDCAYPVAGSYRVNIATNSILDLEARDDLSATELQVVDARADVLLPPDLDIRGINPRNPAVKEAKKYWNSAVDCFNNLRLREKQLEYCRREHLAAAGHEANAASLENDDCSASTLASTDKRKKRTLGSFEEPDFPELLREPLCLPKTTSNKVPKKSKKKGATAEAKSKAGKKRPTDRLGKKNAKEAESARKLVGKHRDEIESGKKGYSTSEDAAGHDLQPSVRQVRNLSEYVADSPGDDAAKLQPAPPVIRGSLQTLEERHVPQVSVYTLPTGTGTEGLGRQPSQISIRSAGSFSGFLRQQESDVRSTSSSRSNPANRVGTNYPLGAKSSFTTGNASNGPPRRSARLSAGGIVSSDSVPVRNSATSPPPLPQTVSRGQVTPRRSSASSETSESDEEEDNEPDWEIRAWRRPSASVPTRVGTRNLSQASPTEVEELGDGFGDEEEEDDLDDAEGETDDEMEFDDDCDSVMPSPERKWIDRGSPHSPGTLIDDEEELISPTSSDEEREVEDYLIPVPSLTKEAEPFTQDIGKASSDEEEFDEEPDDPIHKMLRALKPELFADATADERLSSASASSEDEDWDAEYDAIIESVNSDDKENNPYSHSVATSDDSGWQEDCGVVAPALAAPAPDEPALPRPPVKWTYGKQASLSSSSRPAKRKFDDVDDDLLRDISVDDFLSNVRQLFVDAPPTTPPPSPPKSSILAPRGTPPSSPSKKRKVEDNFFRSPSRSPTKAPCKPESAIVSPK